MYMHLRRLLVFLLLPLLWLGSGAWSQSLPQVYAPVYGNWCGPNHPIDMSRAGPPIDSLDGACLRHDQCIAARGQFDCGCDIGFLNELRQTPWPNPAMAQDARAIYDAIAVIPCTSPDGTMQKQSMFAADLAADVLARGGNPLEVLHRWQNLFLGNRR